MLVLFSTLFLAACGGETDTNEPDLDVPFYDRMVATITPTAESDVTGSVTFTREQEGIRVIATVSGLEPESLHGFHIHEFGDCSADDGTSAGGHYDPFGMPHSGPDNNQRHMGDLGNLVADENGIATIDFYDSHLELDGDFTILGRGVIVHAGEDDLESQPTGDAGARLGCGVIGVARTLQ
ncbi:MAG: superoxide dismutase family protein [Balneolaceae bacterium]